MGTGCLAKAENGREGTVKIPRSPIFFFGATLVAFSVALVVFVAILLLSQRSVTNARESAFHTLEIEQRLSDLQADLVAAEAAQVAVLLTGDQGPLSSYYRATTDIGLTLRSLSFLVADNDLQGQRIVQLKELFREKIREMDETVQTVRIGDQGGALAAARRNATQSSATLRIQEILEAASRTETSIEREHQNNLQISARRRDNVAVALIVLLAALMVGLFIAVNRARKYERLIKVCAWSKTVEYEGEWVSYDEYLRRRFNVSVSHGISPDAMEKLDAEA